jgi:hypothetical protein
VERLLLIGRPNAMLKSLPQDVYMMIKSMKFRRRFISPRRASNIPYMR